MVKDMVLIILVIAGFGLVIFGMFVLFCHLLTPHFDVGVVVRKQFVPAHHENQMTWIDEVQVPIPVDIPDQWVILLKSFRGKEAFFNVTRQQFDHIREGEYYRIGDVASCQRLPAEQMR